ncbi:Uncharacterised protein [Mycobacteroides abscessus subsp. abscessus]|nr:Uncharacterised protein [Mycobacteroides abscessus subsp. abscessus]SKT93319.1 Uncharacterised protein [Mycobacteroides abscessus subsp. abscessus]
MAATDIPITWSSAAPPPSLAAAMMRTECVVMGSPSCRLSRGQPVVLAGNISRIRPLKQRYVSIDHSIDIGLWLSAGHGTIIG